jgi:hypothetical protein
MPEYAYHVSFDLHQKPESYYDDLNAQLQLRKGVRILESTWIIKTNETANELCNVLYRHINQDDRLFASQINRNRQGWLNARIWPWLNRTFTASSSLINLIGF